MTDLGRNDSLFGWPGANGGQTAPGMLCVVGAPTDRGNAISKGAGLGPSAIRRESRNLPPPRTSGVDWGDVENDGGLDLVAYLDRLSETANSIFERNLRPLMIGGDHSITYAPVSALQESQDVCLIWLDAHTDFSPWSGRGAHSHKQVLRRIAGLDGIHRIIQIGYRGFTTGDERRLGANSSVVTSAQARVLSTQGLLEIVPTDMACYISVDIDVIDPHWAPGTSAPVPDGLSPEEVWTMLKAIVRNRIVAGIDLVEVNPKCDMRSATSHLAARLIRGLADSWAYQIHSAKGAAARFSTI